MSNADWEKSRRLTTLVDELEKAIKSGDIDLKKMGKAAEYERLHRQYVSGNWEVNASQGEFSQPFLQPMQEYLTFVEEVLATRSPDPLDALLGD